MSKTAQDLLAQDEALDLILRERDHQDALKAAGKFQKTCADDMPNLECLAVLVEEVGEVSRHVCDEMHGKGLDVDALKAEIAQVAAVSLAWLEGLSK